MYIERLVTYEMHPAIAGIWNQNEVSGNEIADYEMFVRHALSIARIPDILEGYAYYMHSKDSSILHGTLKPETDVVEMNTIAGIMDHILISCDLSLHHSQDLITKVSFALLNLPIYNTIKGGIVFSHALPADSLPTSQTIAISLVNRGGNYPVIPEFAKPYSYDKLKAFGVNVRDALENTIIPKGLSTIITPPSPWVTFQS